jgi:hypothetical protein
MPERPRIPRIPLTVPQLELVFEGLQMVAEGADDTDKLHDAVELAGRVRQALDRAKLRQAG